MQFYFYIKALHIIFVVCWFAGLFYSVRLFVYYAEGKDRPENERAILLPQYELMIRRLFFIITFPSGVLTTVFGMIMLSLNQYLLTQWWMWIKLFMVLLLWIYHFRCHQFVKQIEQKTFSKSGRFFRIWNEGATILLFAIVFLVVLKTTFGWIFGVLGLVGLAVLLMLGIKFYEKKRKSSGK